MVLATTRLLLHRAGNPHAMSGTPKSLAVAVAASAGLMLVGLGSAATAQAQPAYVLEPPYHWCPGDAWLPEWGFNWEWALCHDNSHRDIDGDYHGDDWHGPPAPGVTPHPWYPAGPPGGPPPAVWWRP